MTRYLFVHLSDDGREWLAPRCCYDGCPPLVRAKDIRNQVTHRHASAGGLGHRVSHCNPKLGHGDYELTLDPALHGQVVPR